MENGASILFSSWKKKGIKMFSNAIGNVKKTESYLII